jgi:hypothetical protein
MACDQSCCQMPPNQPLHQTGRTGRRCKPLHNVLRPAAERQSR